MHAQSDTPRRRLPETLIRENRIELPLNAKSRVPHHFVVYPHSVERNACANDYEWFRAGVQVQLMR